MRVVWKDSAVAKTCPPLTYRKIIIERYETETIKGWTTSLAGDRNIYANQDSARNAINKALGGKPRKDGSRLAEAGIKIIGVVDETPGS